MHSIANFSVLSGDPDPMPLIYVFLFMGFCPVDLLWCVLDSNF